MKCYTVTEKGVAAGIEFMTAGPYPHICVGDPSVQYDHRRVEVDAALAAAANGGKIHDCSMALDMNEADRRRASYKLVPPAGQDNDKVLVMFEVRPGGDGRTWYDFPRDTFMLAKGWYSKTPRGPRVSAPVELAVLNKEDAVRVYKATDISQAPAPLLTVRFDGSELKAA